MKVWILLAKSESGDDYGPWVFLSKPTKTNLKAFLKKKCPNEFEDAEGPGEWGSYLHISVHATETLP